MPILKQLDADAPLNQGDVLKGLRLYSTGHDWGSTDASGGSPEWAKHCVYSMVVSRPCVVYHKPAITVAAISVVKGDVPSIVKSFAEVRAFLNHLRDGYGRPDRFYLGQIPNADLGRYYAHLDSFHTVARPGDAELKAFLASNRVATLTDSFRRDLYLRVLACIANLGFDDYGWLSDRNLQWLLEAGDAELHQKKAGLASEKTKLAEILASGESKSASEKKNREKTLASQQKEIEDFERDLGAYRREAQSREQKAD